MIIGFWAKLSALSYQFLTYLNSVDQEHILVFNPINLLFCSLCTMKTPLFSVLFLVAGLDQSNRKVHYAHRSVLAAASAYFNAMFTSGKSKQKKLMV